MKNRWMFLGILVAFLIVLFLPFELTIAPGRQLIITDAKGAPIPCVLVRQSWYQYSLDLHGEENFVLFNDNKASLPERYVQTNVLSLMAGAIRNVKETGIHASFRSDETVGIFAKGYQDKWLYGEAGQEKNEVVLSEGVSPRIKLNLDEYLIQKCRELKPGTKVADLTELFFLPDIENTRGDTVWLSFELENSGARPIRARVDLKDGAVLELRCPDAGQNGGDVCCD